MQHENLAKYYFYRYKTHKLYFHGYHNNLLKKNGLLALEIGLNQYQEVSGILRSYRFREITKEYDYNRNVRCIISTKVSFY